MAIKRKATPPFKRKPVEIPADIGKRFVADKPIKQHLRFLQVKCVEAFGEPPVERSEQFARLLQLGLVAPEPPKVVGGAPQPARCEARMAFGAFVSPPVSPGLFHFWDFLAKPLICLVGAAGLEPATR